MTSATATVAISNSNSNNNNSANNANHSNNSSSDISQITAVATETATVTAPTISLPLPAVTIATNGSLHGNLNTVLSTVTTATTTTSTTMPATRTMQSDEDFNIKFVNLVRLHKCLYDKKVPEYRNRDNQEKAWSLISQETRESVIHCKERWRNLRACLSRYIKQQSGSDPQHKPYYLTEHMAFLLPFLKSTRNSLESNAHCGGLNGVMNDANLSGLFQISATHLRSQNTVPALQVLPQLPQPHSHTQYDEGQCLAMGVKHSLSDNDDEETIDAFDPAITATLQQHHQRLSGGSGGGGGSISSNMRQHHSPMLSDTASANTMQNFIPDVQLSELRTPDGAQEVNYGTTAHTNCHRDTRDFLQEPKRIKTECNHASSCDERSSTAMHMFNNCVENSDMDFFRSLLPDIVQLTPQQKRKFKIGILELIDDILERYPGVERLNNVTGGSSAGSVGGGGGGGGITANKHHQQQQHDWRK